MKRKPLNDAPCCIARSLDQIGEWWSLLIVRDILQLGNRRFGELLESLGCARNMLSARLKRLVACGILTTGPAADGSAYQEYRLTEKGRDLYLTLIALHQWGERWNSRPGEKLPEIVERATGKPIVLGLLTENGRPMAPREIDVRLPANAAESGDACSVTAAVCGFRSKASPVRERMLGP